MTKKQRIKAAIIEGITALGLVLFGYIMAVFILSY